MSANPIITLTTDFGLKDYYSAVIKAKILGSVPQTSIVDISHRITPFDLNEGAYILGAAYPHFPEGSIHIVALDTMRADGAGHLVIYRDGQYFVGADNGFFPLMFNDDSHLYSAFQLEQKGSRFPALDILAPAAMELAKGIRPEAFAKPTSQIQMLRRLNPTIKEGAPETIIQGSVVYIDVYGNAVTNISKSLVERFKHLNFLRIQAREHTFEKLYDSFPDFINAMAQNKTSETKSAVYNFNNLITIALYRANPRREGSAASLLGVDLGRVVSVHFSAI